MSHEVASPTLEMEAPRPSTPEPAVAVDEVAVTAAPEEAAPADDVSAGAEKDELLEAKVSEEPEQDKKLTNDDGSAGTDAVVEADTGELDTGLAAAALMEGDEDVSVKGCIRDIKSRTAKDWAGSFLRLCLLSFFLYFFLFGLDLMGTAFKILGGCTAGELFKEISNPIAGLMTGILATVLVQSSSTSTSIVVSLVGAGAMTVKTGIPVIMGANIGTSVTNTIVSMGHLGEKKQLKLAFAGATVHDMFNFLAVLILLPLEEITHMLYYLTKEMTPNEVDDKDDWEGPVKRLVQPLVKQILVANKDVIKLVAQGGTSCKAIYNDDSVTGLIKCDDDYGCPAFYNSNASQDDDMAAGGVCLFISLVVLIFCLIGLVKLLQYMVLGKAQVILRKATDLHWTLSMMIGCGITILVQSSSITTSVLTPFVGLEVITLEQMFPLTLGANIGTTCTALMASLVSDKPDAVQIALVHLFFNIIGIGIWYPIPFMRRLPLYLAKGLGGLTERYHLIPLVYIVIAFVIAPAALLGLSLMFEAGAAVIVLGSVIVTALIAWAVYTVYWWKFKNGRETTWSYLDRKELMSSTLNSLPEDLKLLRQDVDTLKASVLLLAGPAKELHSDSDSKTPEVVAPAMELVDEVA